MMRGPLDGIRVVEAGQMVSAPLATMLLADQGADVVKVEAADGVGDRMRGLGSRRGGIAAMFAGVNRGKRSITLDTKDPRGRDVLIRLIEQCDVFVQNYRPGAVDRMGVGEPAMRERNPGLVYVSISGFGETGPYASQKAYDYVVQALTGMAALQADPRTGDPALIRNIVVDKATAYTACQAITAALFARERGAGGQHVRINMLDVGLAFFWPDGMMDHALVGDGVHRAPHNGSYYEVRRTSDGHVSLMAAGNRSWPGFCQALRPEWKDDPRFASVTDRERHSNELSAEVDKVLADLTTAEVLERLRAADVPCAPVVALEDVAAEPQVVHNQSLVTCDWPGIGPIVQARPAARFDRSGGSVAGPVPRLGEHTDEVLSELGLDGDERSALRAAGVLG